MQNITQQKKKKVTIRMNTGMIDDKTFPKQIYTLKRNNSDCAGEKTLFFGRQGSVQKKNLEF